MIPGLKEDDVRNNPVSKEFPERMNTMINTSQDLKDLLFRINRKSYPAYKDTKGSYRFPGYVLSIDHVQGDPFAAPSKLSFISKVLRQVSRRLCMRHARCGSRFRIS